MIGCEIEAIEEVSSQDRLADIGDDECEVESAVGYAYLAIGESIAGNVGAVGCL